MVLATFPGPKCDQVQANSSQERAKGSQERAKSTPRTAKGGPTGVTSALRAAKADPRAAKSNPRAAKSDPRAPPLPRISHLDLYASHFGHPGPPRWPPGTLRIALASSLEPSRAMQEPKGATQDLMKTTQIDPRSPKSSTWRAKIGPRVANSRQEIQKAVPDAKTCVLRNITF